MTQEIERKDIDKIDWNEHAEYWDTFPEGKFYTDNTFRLLTDFIDLENLTILDFGSGTGLLTERMAKKAKQIVAIDTSKKMIEVLNNKNLNNVETILAELSQKTMDENPILQSKFDLVVASSVCAFLPNYEEVLTTIKSLLKPNGFFVQWDWIQTEKDPNFGFTEEILSKYYNSVGLKIVSISNPFHLEGKEEKMEVLMAIGQNI